MQVGEKTWVEGHWRLRVDFGCLQVTSAIKHNLGR